MRRILGFKASGALICLLANASCAEERPPADLACQARSDLIPTLLHYTLELRVLEEVAKRGASAEISAQRERTLQAFNMHLASAQADTCIFPEGTSGRSIYLLAMSNNPASLDEMIVSDDQSDLSDHAADLEADLERIIAERKAGTR